MVTVRCLGYITARFAAPRPRDGGDTNPTKIITAVRPVDLFNLHSVDIIDADEGVFDVLYLEYLSVGVHIVT